MASIKHLEELSDLDYTDISMFSFKPKKLYPKLVPEHEIFAMDKYGQMTLNL